VVLFPIINSVDFVALVALLKELLDKCASAIIKCLSSAFILGVEKSSSLLYKEYLESKKSKGANLS
jgi:hypothetical protein